MYCVDDDSQDCWWCWAWLLSPWLSSDEGLARSSLSEGGQNVSDKRQKPLWGGWFCFVRQLCRDCISYHWILWHCRMQDWDRSRRAARRGEKEQKQQLSHPHSSTASIFTFVWLFQSFWPFRARVRLIFTPRSQTPCTYSPILVLTPSFCTRSDQSWKYCFCYTYSRSVRQGIR